uniref:Uncharacterized protein n=1 Tax=Anguilla anguilla TaxID=7936 RepID=A0A0E9UYW7_ANGAN
MSLELIYPKTPKIDYLDAVSRKTTLIISTSNEASYNRKNENTNTNVDSDRMLTVTPLKRVHQ